MNIDDNVWAFFQNHLGYTDEEMDIFKKDPRNLDVISKGMALMNKTFVVEVVDSHGCNSQHKVGEKFYLDGGGNIISKLCPKRMCIFALSAMTPGIHAATELHHAGVDPNEMRFKRVGCSDVGLSCGGWGHIVMEIRTEDRK